MLTSNTIYTPLSMYFDFQPNLPLRESTVSEERVGDIVYSEVYFNGREVSEGRVLIYGIYARHIDGKKHNAILIIPDYKNGMDINVINLYAKLGYDVLMFDYRGEWGGQDNYTHYPSMLKYANLKYAGRHLDFADADARHTCWYEWCCVARYAVSFLRSRIETNKIGVLGIKNGADIMWHLLSCENRISCAVALFGAGWRSYKNVVKYSNQKNEVTDERIRFLAGIDAHAYAPYCKCPVALFTATNCGEFDADRAHDTIRRVNANVDKFFCLAPRMENAVNFNCTRNIELFFGVYLNGQRIQLAVDPIINLEVIGEAVRLEVIVPEELKPRLVDIYVCENQNVPSRRNWIKLADTVKDGETRFYSDYTLINGGGTLFAFAVIEYRNGITVSTPITSKKCPETPVIKTNLIYSSNDGVSDFIYAVSPNDVIGDAILYKRSPLETKKGPMGIVGITSRSGLRSYKLNDRCVEIKSDSVFKFDLYCSEEISLNVVLASFAGTKDEQIYNIEIDVPKGEVWQNIVLELKAFKTKDGMSILDCNSIDYIQFTANGQFGINNVLLI